MHITPYTHTLVSRTKVQFKAASQQKCIHYSYLSECRSQQLSCEAVNTETRDSKIGNESQILLTHKNVLLYIHELQRHLWCDVNTALQTFPSLCSLSFPQQLGCSFTIHLTTPERTKQFTNYSLKLVSSWILTSCQPRRVISGRCSLKIIKKQTTV